MFRASHAHPGMWHRDHAEPGDGRASAVAIAFAVIAAASLVLDLLVTLVGAAPH